MHNQMVSTLCCFWRRIGSPVRLIIARSKSGSIFNNTLSEVVTHGNVSPGTCTGSNRQDSFTHKYARHLLVQWSVSLIVGQVKVGTQITEHLETMCKRKQDGHERQTYPTQFLVSFQSCDVQSGFPRRIRPVEYEWITVEI